MATYKYKAQTAEGKQVRGIVQAVSEFDAADKIRQNAPVILSITPVKESGGLLSTQIGGKKLSIKALSVMCSQIAITLKSGIPLARCLEMIGNQTQDKALRKMLLATSDEVSGGSSLTASMERNGEGLPATFRETIRAGEESGNIEHSFGEMARYYENQYKTASKIKSALSYPIFVVVVAVIVLVIVMVMVVPALTKTFDSLGGNLPIITEILIRISDFFGKYWVLLAVLVLALVLAWRVYTKTPSGKLRRGAMQLSTPVLGKIHRLNGAAQFANTMSMLLKSGLTVDRAVAITARTLDNEVMNHEVEGIVGRIEEGRPLGECIRQCPHFPRTLQEMCAIGEETGELDGTLEVIGQFYSNEADTATKDALAKLEPTMLCFLAVFAGFIVIAIYMPMFTMYNLM